MLRRINKDINTLKKSYNINVPDNNNIKTIIVDFDGPKILYMNLVNGKLK